MTAYHQTGDSAAIAQSLDGAAQWVQLLPIGDVATRPHDGRAPWVVRDAAAVVAATRALGHDLVIDYEHQTDRASDNGKPAPAAGWVTEIAVRNDGIYGKVDWTDRAKRMLDAREYRFLSPVFQFEKSSRAVRRILRAALTNDPALFLKAVASRGGLSDSDFASAGVTGEDLNDAERAICRQTGLSEARYQYERDFGSNTFVV